MLLLDHNEPRGSIYGFKIRMMPKIHIKDKPPTDKISQHLCRVALSTERDPSTRTITYIYIAHLHHSGNRLFLKMDRRKSFSVDQRVSSDNDPQFAGMELK